MVKTEAVGGVLDSDAGSSARVKSDVWNFFDKTGHQTVKCKLCNKRYAYHGGTTNLHDHLNRVHSNNTRRNQNTIQLWMLLSPDQSAPTSRAKRIPDLIADMVTQDLRPAALVEGRGFEAPLSNPYHAGGASQTRSW